MLSDIMKMKGLFDEHELLESLIEGNSNMGDTVNALSSLSEEFQLNDIDELEGDGSKNAPPSKRMIVCGKFLCELYHLNSVENVDNWKKDKWNYGLKFKGLNIEHRC